MARSTQGVFSARFLESHWLIRYGLAVLVYGLVIGIILLNQWLAINLNLTMPIVLGLVAVVWYCGRGPGIFLSFLYQITTAVLTAFSGGGGNTARYGLWMFEARPSATFSGEASPRMSGTPSGQISIAFGPA